MALLKQAQRIVNAFFQHKEDKFKWCESTGTELNIFGNTIAKWSDDILWVTNAGWDTKTTRAVLSLLPDIVVFRSSKGQTMLGHFPGDPTASVLDGTWHEIGKWNDNLDKWYWDYKFEDLPEKEYLVDVRVEMTDTYRVRAVNEQDAIYKARNCEGSRYYLNGGADPETQWSTARAYTEDGE